MSCNDLADYLKYKRQMPPASGWHLIYVTRIFMYYGFPSPDGGGVSGTGVMTGGGVTVEAGVAVGTGVGVGDGEGVGVGPTSFLPANAL